MLRIFLRTMYKLLNIIWCVSSVIILVRSYVCYRLNVRIEIQIYNTSS